jgi:transposase InsO family protein
LPKRLAIRVRRKLKATDVIDALSYLFILRRVSGLTHSDNGPEFVATAVGGWIAAVGAKTAYIALGSPWENGFIERFGAGFETSFSMAGLCKAVLSGLPGRKKLTRDAVSLTIAVNWINGLLIFIEMRRLPHEYEDPGAIRRNSPLTSACAQEQDHAYRRRAIRRRHLP